MGKKDKKEDIKGILSPFSSLFEKRKNMLDSMSEKDRRVAELIKQLQDEEGYGFVMVIAGDRSCQEGIDRDTNVKILSHGLCSNHVMGVLQSVKDKMLETGEDGSI